MKDVIEPILNAEYSGDEYIDDNSEDNINGIEVTGVSETPDDESSYEDLKPDDE